MRLNQQVSGVTRVGAGFRVSLSSGDEIVCDALTLAVPPDVAALLIPAGLPDASALAAGIGVAEIETLVLAVPTRDLNRRHLPPLAGLIAVDDVFYSAVSRDYVMDPLWRGFAFHFQPGGIDHADQLKRACRALGVGTDRVADVAYLINRLPALRKGHVDLVAQIDKALEGTRLGVTGNWFIGVSIEDCLTRSRQEVDRLFPSPHRVPRRLTRSIACFTLTFWHPASRWWRP